MKYLVEFLGSKGWEITHEGDDPDAALAAYSDLLLDMMNDPSLRGARLTAEEA